MASAMLTQHQLAFRHPDGPGVDDLVSGLLLEVSILMDAGLVGEGVASDDGFVRLWAEADDRAQHLARRIEMLGVDSSSEGITIVASLDRHHYFFERAVA